MPVKPEQTQLRSGEGSAGPSKRRLGLLVLHLLMFLLLRFLVFDVGVVDASYYRRVSILPGLGLRLFGSLSGITLLLASAAFLWLGDSSWQSVKHGTFLKWLSGIGAVSLALTFVGQGVNLYFGQEYLLDRVCVLALALLVFSRPVFIVPFLLVLIAFAGQFQFPIEGYGWAIHLLGIQRFQVLILLAVFSAFLLHQRVEDFPVLQGSLFLSLIIAASFYWVPGLGKLRIEWWSLPTAHWSLFGAWSHGWLADWSGEQILACTARMRPLAMLLQAVVLFAECGAIFVLFRRCALILLPLWIAFHVGVWFAYGFSFWAWIAIDGCLLLFVWKHPAEVRFSRWECGLAVGLIVVSPYWVNPNRLAWFNAPLANTFRVVATTAEGAEFEVPPGAFSPYEYIFTMQQFGDLSDVPLIVGPYGATSSAKRASRSGEDLARLQGKGESREQNPEFKEQIASLMRKYASQWNAGRTNRSQLWFLRLPQTLNTSLPSVDMTAQELVRLRLERRVHFVRGEEVVKQVAQVCFEIDVRP